MYFRGMNASIVTAIISSSGAIILAALSFFLTKRYERLTEWRQKKLDHYKQLLSAISDLAVDGIDKEEANKRFSFTVNTIALVAPQKVITALMNFHQEIKYTNKNFTRERHDQLLIELVLAIRRDIKLTTKDNKETFVFRLIGSAPPKKTS
jgi:hypothetical protein